MLNPAFGEVVPPEFQVTETVNGPTICQSKREVGETGVHFSAGKPINFFSLPHQNDTRSVAPKDPYMSLLVKQAPVQGVNANDERRPKLSIKPEKQNAVMRQFVTDEAVVL